MHKTIIPIIDLREIDSPKHQVTIARQIYHACTEHGFFYVSGHGVDAGLQDELMEKSKLFFALREKERLKIAMAKGGSAWRGFFPVTRNLRLASLIKKRACILALSCPMIIPRLKQEYHYTEKIYFTTTHLTLTKPCWLI